MAEQDGVRGAIIGCGAIAPEHLKSYKAQGIELSAVCDVDRGNAERRKGEFGTRETKLFTDHKEMLSQIGDQLDFVTVATPVAFHAPLTIDALRAGKHVVCEKPSTLSIDENKAVVAEAKRAQKKVVFCSARMRWSEAALAKQYVADGEMGEIYRVDVQYYRRRGRPGVDILPHARWFIDAKLAGGGVIMDMGQYFMDMVLNLVGWPRVDAVSGTTFRGFPHELPPGTTFDVEEHCTFLARCAGPLTLTFDIAWISNHAPKRVITLLGTKGGIRIDDAHGGFTFFSDRGGPWRWMNTTTDWKDKTHGNDHLYQEFLQAIAGTDPGIGTTPEQALAITELTQMVLRSAKENREIRRAELA